MEVVVKTAVNAVENNSRQSAKGFWKDFAQGYLDVEKMKQSKELRKYKKAYKELEDKDSFHAQYLETLIWNLEH
ncbi:MAG: hypothetical protein BAJALOKI3v1_300037 [Promethearchaeota archaeon]|jgi:hypothetical protein|nr:MAG: hypothetical protein BAJALOKI3v1_300037 [Candidatus Lokiarchaeota archaeon]